MKIKHIWSVLCRESVVNMDDNVISLLGVLEDLSTSLTPMNPELPRPEKINIPFNFEIVNYWTKESSEEIRMQIKTATIDPDGKELNSVVSESIFPKGVKKLRSRLKVQGLAVTKNGEYTFRISVKTAADKDYKLVAELPLSVKIQIEAVNTPAKS